MQSLELPLKEILLLSIFYSLAARFLFLIGCNFRCIVIFY